MGQRLFRKQCATGAPGKNTTRAIPRHVPAVRPGTDVSESDRAGKYLRKELTDFITDICM